MLGMCVCVYMLGSTSASKSGRLEEVKPQRVNVVFTEDLISDWIVFLISLYGEFGLFL
jgi:hypothetical protein